MRKMRIIGEWLTAKQAHSTTKQFPLMEIDNDYIHYANFIPTHVRYNYLWSRVNINISVWSS